MGGTSSRLQDARSQSIPPESEQLHVSRSLSLDHFRMRPVTRRILWCALTLLLLLVAGCGDEITIRGGPSAVDYVRRAGVFVTLASLALASGRTLWGQSIRALYYAAYTLARSKRGLLASTTGRDGHEVVWKQSPKTARRFFGDVLRPLRNKWDYDVLPPDDEPVEEDLRLVLERGPEAFAALLDDVRTQVAPEPHVCPGNPAECTHCRRRGLPECSRAEVDSSIEVLEAQLREVWAKGIPEALSRTIDEPDVLPSTDATPH